MACSCAWLLDIAQVYSMLSSYLTFILPVILPHFYLTCHLTLPLSCLSSYLTFIVPVILPHFYLTCHLTSLLSYLSSYLTFIVPVILPHFYRTCHLTSLLSSPDCCRLLLEAPRLQSALAWRVANSSTSTISSGFSPRKRMRSRNMKSISL